MAGVSGSAKQICFRTKILAICVLGFPGISVLPAQNLSPSSSLNGTWVNVDPQTRDVVRIVINERKIHPYGACQPDPCDWGVLKGKSFASGVDSSNATALTAKMTTSFDRVDLTLSLESDGRLRAEAFTHFTDGSGRADYRAVNYFIRGRIPYVP